MRMRMRKVMEACVYSVPGQEPASYRIGELKEVEGAEDLNDWTDLVLGVGVDMLECSKPSRVAGLPCGMIGSRWLSVDGVWPTHVGVLVELGEEEGESK